ncbi:MAG: DegT/DnrJ/EryC1/StrS family aminotransferase [Spirochaetaceae bacterium]|nr:DegT/DnrJ/EryC1/StrS family aminotransferase [Spirochaetaceae bacterium]
MTHHPGSEDEARRKAKPSLATRVLPYSTGVWDEEEIEAVTKVLRGPPQSIMIGPHVAEFERRVAELFGKRFGVMCNSGSSALYLAVELLELAPGDEIITSPLTFSTDLAPMLRAGLVPVFADVEEDTFQIDVTKVEEMIGPRTRALLVPNLTGNAPDWDRLREIADRHGLKVVEDSCDALGAKLRGTPTGTRSDISVTSFANAHIITAMGNGGMVCLDDERLVDKCLLLRRWGRRSEIQMFGSRRNEPRDFWEDLDGTRYDNLFIFDLPGWNFEPSEVGAAFGLKQLDKLPRNHARRERSFAMLCEALARHPDLFIPPRTTDGLYTAWHTFCFIIRKDAGFERADLQSWLEERGIATRMVWTGNAARQPMMEGATFRQPPGGLPNADQVMERGMLVSMNHGMDDDDIAYVIGHIEGFVADRRGRA